MSCASMRLRHRCNNARREIAYSAAVRDSVMRAEYADTLCSLTEDPANQFRLHGFATAVLRARMIDEDDDDIGLAGRRIHEACESRHIIDATGLQSQPSLHARGPKPVA